MPKIYLETPERFRAGYRPVATPRPAWSEYPTPQTYLESLERAANANRSLICVGLDPDPGRLPADGVINGVLEFNCAIVDATADLVCAYKPNLAFYEALGMPGLRALEKTVRHIREVAPTAQIIGDAKRGDGGPSAAAYARAMFEVWGFDAVTVNPWGGADAALPFLEDPTRGAFVWCRGSFDGAADLQELPVESPHGRISAAERLVHTLPGWNHKGNLGMVIGAGAPEFLATARNILPDAPILIPGIGAQGGDLAAAVRKGVDQNGRRAIISSSRGIIYASSGNDFAIAARQAAGQLRDAVNEVLQNMGLGWAPEDPKQTTPE